MALLAIHDLHCIVTLVCTNFRYEWPCRCSSKFRVAESDLLAGFDRFACVTCGVVIRVLAAIVDETDSAATVASSVGSAPASQHVD